MTQEAKKDSVEATKELVGYSWNFVCDIGNNRQVSLTGTFPKGADVSTMNSEVDKVRAVFDRQQAKSAVLAIEQELASLILRRNNCAEDINRIDEKMAAKGGPSSQERTNRENSVLTLNNMDKDIEYKTAVLEKMKEEAK